MVYPALLPLMRTPRLSVVDWTDAPRRFKWTRPFRRKTKSVFCACAITFQTWSTHSLRLLIRTSLPKHAFPRCVYTHSSTVLDGIPNGGNHTAGLVWQISTLHCFRQAIKECVFYIHKTGINTLFIYRWDRDYRECLRNASRIQFFKARTYKPYIICSWQTGSYFYAVAVKNQMSRETLGCMS